MSHLNAHAPFYGNCLTKGDNIDNGRSNYLPNGDCGIAFLN